MKVVIQRVSSASVTIDNKIVADIQKGLLVLVGIEDADNQEDIDGDIIVVSQFTLHAATKKGNRPSYIKASKPEIAIPLYENFVSHLQKELGKKVQTGIFGADMKVLLLNDGPVTITIDSKNKE